MHAAYKTYGKQFHLIAEMLPHKAQTDVVEYYYAYFKRDPVFSSVKDELRIRARAEAFRAQTEGAVTVRVPRGRVGANEGEGLDGAGDWLTMSG